MAINSGIEWIDHTVNFWQGCTKVSAECKNCYMYREKKRFGKDPSMVVRSAPATFNAILNRNRFKPGDSVFPCSWSDFFHEAADPWRADAYAVMRQRPDLNYVLVTKRIERAEQCWPEDWGDGWPNVVVCVTAGTQDTANQWIPVLLRTRARWRGVSMEPLLEAVDIAKYLTCESCLDPSVHWCVDAKLDWVIVGGESGPGARPMHPQWARSLRDQCATAGVPFFFKQWGEWREFFMPGHDQKVDARSLSAVTIYKSAIKPGFITLDGKFYAERKDLPYRIPCRLIERVGKKAAGRLLDGVEHNARPALFVEVRA